MFGFVAPLIKANLPSSPLQSHLKQLDNLMCFCDTILAVYFSSDHPCKICTLWSDSHFDDSLIKTGFFTFAHKLLTNLSRMFLLLSSVFPCMLALFYLLYFWVWKHVVLFPSHLSSAFSFSFCGRSLGSSLSRSPPACSGNNGCKPAETNSACKQRVQLNRKGASAFPFFSLYGFIVALNWSQSQL